MFIQPNATRITHSPTYRISNRITPKSSRATTVVFRVVGFMVVICALSITIVYFAARAQPLPTLIEPPQQFLPGNELPAPAYCKTASDGHCYPPLNTHCDVPGDGRCFTFLSTYITSIGKSAYLTVEIASGQIMQTILPTSGYTIGDLMTVWGTPLSVQQSGRTITVYWSTRSAYIITCSFQPESRVEWITYFTPPVQARPWRGFHNRKNC